MADHERCDVVLKINDTSFRCDKPDGHAGPHYTGWSGPSPGGMSWPNVRVFSRVGE